MITWTGWGWLGLFPLVLSTIIFTVAWEIGFSGRGDGPELGAAMMLASSALWLLGRRLNRGSRRFTEAPHSLFMSPLEIYAVPLFAAGGLLLIAALMAPR